MRALFDERRKDRLARLIITCGGVIVILLVVGIVLNITSQAAPLFGPASLGPAIRQPHSDGLLAGTDRRLEFTWVLLKGGAFEVSSSAESLEIQVTEEGETVMAADLEVHGLISMLTDRSVVRVGRLAFRDRWLEGSRVTEPGWRSYADPLTLEDDVRWDAVTANQDDDGNILVAAISTRNAAKFWSWSVEDLAWEPVAVPVGRGVVDAAIAEHLESIAVLDEDGSVRIFRLPGLEATVVSGIDHAVAGLRFLLGGGTLIAPGSDHTLRVAVRVPRIAVFNRSPSPRRVAGGVVEPGETVVVPDDGISFRHAVDDRLELHPASSSWQVVRALGPLSSTITSIAPSHRRRGFAAGCGDGSVALFHATSGRLLNVEEWSTNPIESLTMSPRVDSAVATAGLEVVRRTIRNEHPEISLRTLFLPVWYEDHPAPDWVWQTSGGSEDFEPKFSLWPLLFGTFKATLYAMLVSVPLALLSAVYVSQLAPEWLRSVVKPSVELMAAVPSVIVGFVAALWLAPRLESFLFPALLTTASLPAAVFVSAASVRLLPRSIRSRVPRGSELGFVVAGGAFVVVLVALAANPLEHWLFGGDFPRFLFAEFGIRYDQRNALVVGLALGFAVIPIIFTVAEDACSAVPRSLIRAARALGATRWQAAMRLVIPAATPGLAAAVMLGLGRAVGETMIVLMAAGNTPILDLLPVNGMRTMAAAIAFEIPEAAIGGTLYRVLFLVGCLLFAVSFVFTTTADIVGRKLRKRYARF